MDSSADSGEEYIPNPKEESTDSDSSSQSSQKSTNHSRAKSFTQSHYEFSSQSHFKYSSVQSSVISTNQSQFEKSNGKEVNVSKPSTCVCAVSKKDDGSRRYNKIHHCLYCNKEVQKMSKHLKNKHSNEIDVAKALSCKVNSKERKVQLDYIRNKGNFAHNLKVLESKEGRLIPCKQPKKETEGAEYLHCVHCYGLFKRKAMWRHFQVCKLNPKSTTSGKTRVQTLCAFAEHPPTEFSTEYWKFLSCMNQDRSALAVKEDPCILEYGYRLFKKNERRPSQHQQIRSTLRELGRLVLAAKEVTPVKTIRELIKPESYNHAVTAARHLTGFSDDTGKYKTASLARKVGHTLHSLAMFLKSEGLKKKDENSVKDAEEFAQLYRDCWKFDIASHALTQLEQSKWNAPQLLPFTKDVQNLHSHLSVRRQQCVNALKEESSPQNWRDLAKVTLTEVITFNRRRSGEVSRMPLAAYLTRDTSETHEDINLALTELEQKLCKHFARITIVGKRGRKVPVLLTPLMRESLDLLVEKRDACGVLKENGFLFALPKSVNYIRGSDCIRQFVQECNVKNPEALTSTKLRKHIATLSTILNLKTTEVDQLADYLGHNIAVHRKHYRLPEGTLQLAKISKVLMAIEQGRLGEFKGKCLDEIHVDPNGNKLYRNHSTKKHCLRYIYQK